MSLPPQTIEELGRRIGGDEAIPLVVAGQVVAIVELREEERLAFERAKVAGYLEHPAAGRRWALGNAWRAWCACARPGRRVVEVTRRGDQARIEVQGPVEGVFETLAGAGADVVAGGVDWVAGFGVPLPAVARILEQWEVSE